MESWSKRRIRGIRIPISKRICFVYCGECTEPNYFKSLISKIKKNYYEKSYNQTSLCCHEQIDATDPLTMAKHVNNSKLSQKYDEVWVVFDKDSFPSSKFDNAILSIISKKNQHALWSNQCIELWFVLHFDYLQSQLERKDYFKKLSKCLNNKYKKNDPNIYNVIIKSKGKVGFAIENAKKLLKKFSKTQSFSKKFPATNVVEFFIAYKDYI